jgi:hypothetical protein
LLGVLLALATSLPGIALRISPAPARAADAVAASVIGGSVPRNATGNSDGPGGQDRGAPLEPAAEPATSLASLRDFARQQAQVRLEGLVHLTAAERQALQDAPGTGGSASAPRGGGQIRSFNAIPDRIEGERAFRASQDALASVRISTSLGLWQGPQAPFQLLAIRTGPGPARVQLRHRDVQGPFSGMPGWFELGEAPIAGWRLVQIAPQGVVLLSPMGNLLHLGFDPEVLPDSDHR